MLKCTLFLAAAMLHGVPVSTTPREACYLRCEAFRDSCLADDRMPRNICYQTYAQCARRCQATTAASSIPMLLASR